MSWRSASVRSYEINVCVHTRMLRCMSWVFMCGYSRYIFHNISAEEGPSRSEITKELVQKIPGEKKLNSGGMRTHMMRRWWQQWWARRHRPPDRAEGWWAAWWWCSPQTCHQLYVTTCSCSWSCISSLTNGDLQLRDSLWQFQLFLLSRISPSDSWRLCCVSESQASYS